LVYVLQNWRKHLAGVPGLDPRSSAAWFTGWWCADHGPVRTRTDRDGANVARIRGLAAAWAPRSP
jgi:hypothetical protein